LLAGRSFDDDLESGAFLINEMMARKLGFSDPTHAIGTPIQVRTADWMFLHWETQEYYDTKDGIVVGVLRDVHYQSLHTPIRPLIMLTEINWKGMMTIRVAGDDVPGALRAMEQAWDRIVPTLPFNPRFLDERFAMAYRAEDRLGKTVGTFAVLAVFVTCLGVFGLGSFMIARRTKEIGVRKCLGASTTEIVVLLSSEPVRLALVACIVAAPITWYAMDQWLQAFAYRIDLGVLVFFLGACGVLLVAWLAVVPLARRAARTAPVEALRYE
jgi:putative ABC transport system permease protein